MQENNRARPIGQHVGAVQPQSIAYPAVRCYASYPGSPAANPAHTDGQSQADAIRDLIAELGFNQTHIVGYSSGAWLAIELLKHHPERVSSLVIGGWDVQNGLPEGPQGRLDFDAFFAFAQATAPALTHWVTQEQLPTLRASFDALAGYQGQQSALRVSEMAVPKMFWAGEEDIYYSPLKGWAEHQHLPFYSVRGDHVSAILNPAADLCQVIDEFLKKAASDSRRGY